MWMSHVCHMWYGTLEIFFSVSLYYVNESWMNESCHRIRSVCCSDMSHVWMSHVTWVMSHVNESCHPDSVTWLAYVCTNHASRIRLCTHTYTTLTHCTHTYTTLTHCTHTRTRSHQLERMHAHTLYQVIHFLWNSCGVEFVALTISVTNSGTHECQSMCQACLAHLPLHTHLHTHTHCTHTHMHSHELEHMHTHILYQTCLAHLPLHTHVRKHCTHTRMHSHELERMHSISNMPCAFAFAHTRTQTLHTHTHAQPRTRTHALYIKHALRICLCTHTHTHT